MVAALLSNWIACFSTVHDRLAGYTEDGLMGDTKASVDKSREPKALLTLSNYWTTTTIQSQIDSLNTNVNNISSSITSLTDTVNSLSSSFASFLSSMQSVPAAGVSGGYETFDDAKTNFTEVFENITNIYEKIQHNRARIATKCTKDKCDKILTKVKKVKASVDFLQNTNVTILETMVEMLKNTTMVSLMVELQTNLTNLQAEVDTLKTNLTTLSTASTTNAQDIDNIGMSLHRTFFLQPLYFLLCIISTAELSIKN